MGPYGAQNLLGIGEWVEILEESRGNLGRLSIGRIAFRSSGISRGMAPADNKEKPQ